MISLLLATVFSLNPAKIKIIIETGKVDALAVSSAIASKSEILYP
jgi:hypothetical protein